MRFFILLFLLIAASGFAKDGGGPGTHGIARGSVASDGGTRAGGGSTMRGGLGERKPPAPLDPSRKVSEQDCSKPIDPQAGNLRCK